MPRFDHQHLSGDAAPPQEMDTDQRVAQIMQAALEAPEPEDDVKTLRLNALALTKMPIFSEEWKSVDADIDLSENQLSEVCPTIRNVDYIYALRLSANAFSVFPQHVLSLEALKVLDLNDNQLSEIRDAIPQLTNVSELFLANNRLKHLPQTISSCKNLRALILNKNQLSQLPPGIEQLQNLNELEISHNQFSQLPHGIELLPELVSLDISHNHLTRLPARLSKSKTLTYIDASHNELSEVSSKIFSRESPLRTLRLEDNHLATISRKCFSSKLELVNLNNNRFETLPSGILNKKRSMTVWLSGNPVMQKTVQQLLEAAST